MDFRNLERTFIVAEIGVNHEGNPDVALDLIRKAAACGVDAVKFQTYRAEHYVSTEQVERRARVERFQLSRDDFRRLADEAKAQGVMFFSTPLHMSDSDFLDEIAPIFKISSGDLTYLELIRHTARKGKPVIISTGAGTEDEVHAAVRAVLSERPDAIHSGSLMLMHCIAAYPAPAEVVNLRNMEWLRKEFGVPVGYSDHTLGTKACELAVAVGAVAIEKHFTYRKHDQAFHDHALSADPPEMTALVDGIRQAELLLGKAVRQRSDAEANILSNLRRSLAVAEALPEGSVIERKHLTYLRPAWGLPPSALDDVLGCRVRRSHAPGQLLRSEDIEPSR